MNKEVEIAFCEGFAYGLRYGYENKLSGEISHKDKGSSWLLSGCLFTRLHPKLAMRAEQRSLYAEELEENK